MTQEILDPYGKTFDWSVKSKMMGRSPMGAAQVLVEELQLPLTSEEFVELSKEKLLQLFPSAPLLPGMNVILLIRLVREEQMGGLKVLKTIFFHLVIDIREDNNSKINIWEGSEKHEGPVLSAMDLRLNVNLALLIIDN